MTINRLPRRFAPRNDVEEIPGQAGDDDELLYRFEIGIRFVRVEDFVAVHYCYEVFCI